MERGEPSWKDRLRKRTTDQEASIQSLAATKNLRSLAADFGVSHETVRAVGFQQTIQRVLLFNPQQSAAKSDTSDFNPTRVEHQAAA